MARIFALVALLGLTGLVSANHDEAMVPGGSGDDMVESICERIEASCIFPDDKLMLRRISYVESQDGLEADTYRDSYHGGIWQVRKFQFNAIYLSETSHKFIKLMRQVQIQHQYKNYQSNRRTMQMNVMLKQAPLVQY